MFAVMILMIDQKHGWQLLLRQYCRYHRSHHNFMVKLYTVSISCLFEKKYIYV